MKKIFKIYYLYGKLKSTNLFLYLMDSFPFEKLTEEEKIEYQRLKKLERTTKL